MTRLEARRAIRAYRDLRRLAELMAKAPGGQARVHPDVARALKAMGPLMTALAPLLGEDEPK